MYGRKQPPGGAKAQMFYLSYPVTNLRPAAYNPRTIDDVAFAALRRSVAALGMVKPIIIGPDGTVIAGHQRLKALQANGGDTAPVYQLATVGAADEIRFNQLHNGTDLDTGDEDVTVPAMPGVTGYYDVAADDVGGDGHARGAPIRAEIARLLIRYGPWGGIVATQSGACLSGAQYALSCRVLGMPVRTYYLPDAISVSAQGYLRAAYGQFDYGHLARETYIQTFAQPSRNNPYHTLTKNNPSWVKYVEPEWKPGETILDFGSGMGVYPAYLAEHRPEIPVVSIEFFRRVVGSELLDTHATYAMADQLFTHLREHGRFDTIICDWVINSVDSQEAEAAVLATCAAMLKPGGRIWLTGRQREWAEQIRDGRTYTSNRRGVEFCDANGLSALMFQSRWFYQKFHRQGEIEALARHYFGGPMSYTPVTDRWRMRIEKAHELPWAEVERALRFEFNLPWPGGRTVGLGQQAVDALRAALQREGS
ncbi:methyltransferase domain-containing protein [Chloroflexales bacterium ZM16-3]|nr:methyltransferase domain-containing protein [Chloroflexales bacterium ZM16-3]